jgi:DNA-binding LytR/AlgR family response regulator
MLSAHHWNNLHQGGIIMTMPVIDENNEIFHMDTSDIFAIIRDKSRKIIVTSPYGTFYIPSTIDQIHTVMEPLGFYAISPSHIINLDQVKAYNKGNVYVDNTHYKVTRRRQEEFKLLIDNHSRNVSGKNHRHTSTDK